jgi:hypothetical protein
VTKEHRCRSSRPSTDLARQAHRADEVRFYLVLYAESDTPQRSQNRVPFSELTFRNPKLCIALRTSACFTVNIKNPMETLTSEGEVSVYRHCHRTGMSPGQP